MATYIADTETATITYNDNTDMYEITADLMSVQYGSLQPGDIIIIQDVDSISSGNTEATATFQFNADGGSYRFTSSYHNYYFDEGFTDLEPFDTIIDTIGSGGASGTVHPLYATNLEGVPDNIDVYVDEAYSMQVPLSPSGSLAYGFSVSSADLDIATTLDDFSPAMNGTSYDVEVDGVQVGSTTVTITLLKEDGTSTIKTINVTVRQAATSFSVDGLSTQTSHSYVVSMSGEQESFSMDFLPAGTEPYDIQTSSSDDSVVDGWYDGQGHLTVEYGGNAGQATLQVDLYNASWSVEESKVYSFDVSSMPISYATDFSLDMWDESSTAFYTEGDMETCNFIWDPSDSEPYSTPTVVSSDPSVVSVNDIQDYAFSTVMESAGSATITVQYTTEATTVVAHTYSVEVMSSTPTYATDFYLMDQPEERRYEPGSTISREIPESGSPQSLITYWIDGDEPYGQLTASTNDSNVATASWNSAQNMIDLTLVGAGSTTLTVSMPLSDGTSATHTYTLEVTSPTPPTPPDLSKLLDGHALQFLKGKIEAAGGDGGVKTLTTDDNNWNWQTKSTENPNCLAQWLLDDGYYVVNDTTMFFPEYPNQEYSPGHNWGSLLVTTVEEVNPGPYGTYFTKICTWISGQSMSQLTFDYNYDVQDGWHGQGIMYFATDSMVESTIQNYMFITYDDTGWTPNEDTWGPSGQINIVVDGTNHTVRAFVCAGGEWDQSQQKNIYYWYEIPVNPITPPNN